jgi:hypothetical protein
MSRTRKTTANRYRHKNIVNQASPELRDYIESTNNTTTRKLPIRTGEKNHRYGAPLRGYYARMKVMGRKRRRAQERDQFNIDTKKDNEE